MYLSMKHSPLVGLKSVWKRFEFYFFAEKPAVFSLNLWATINSKKFFTLEILQTTPATESIPLLSVLYVQLHSKQPFDQNTAKQTTSMETLEFQGG